MRDAIATKRSRRLMLVAVGLLAAAAVLPLLVPPSAMAWELLPPKAATPRPPHSAARAGRALRPPRTAQPHRASVALTPWSRWHPSWWRVSL